jgi:hypothetical protein
MLGDRPAARKASDPIDTGVKQQQHEAGNSPSFKAKAKNAWSFTYIPPLCLNGVLVIVNISVKIPEQS